jgi:hypothetical protein
VGRAPSALAVFVKGRAWCETSPFPTFPLAISGESVFMTEGDCGDGSEAGGVGGASAFERRKLEAVEVERWCLLSSGEEGTNGELIKSMASIPFML